MMFSSSVARRIAINANNTRHNAAATVRSKHHQKLTSSSTTNRSLVSLTQQRQQSQPSVQYYGIDRTAQPLIWCPNTQFVPTKQQHTHHQQKQPKRYMSSSDLPYHLVVGMPALSPTMSSGSISKWNVKEGDTFVAGDSLALIETDKASMDFEAQDDGVVAKLLVAEGGGEIECGTAIMVTVEEEGDVASFANFVADASPAAAAEESAPAVETPPSTPTPPPAAPAEDLPYHLVVGMPALSPTMDAGTISKWNVKEGESFSAGDSIAVIETDKASMDFEAQDDGVVAKLLVEAGSGEVAVGVPVMVTVEEEGDVAAFANFEAGSAPDSSKTEAEVTPEPAVAVSTPPPVAAAPVAAAAPTPTPAAVAAAPVTTTTPSAPLDAISLGGSTWGKLAAEKSPLAKLLASKQKQYIEKYGSTGHIPIV